MALGWIPISSFKQSCEIREKNVRAPKSMRISQIDFYYIFERIDLIFFCFVAIKYVWLFD